MQVACRRPTRRNPVAGAVSADASASRRTAACTLGRLIRELALCWAALALGCTYDYAGATRCNNGVKDGDETGIDCGGACSSCVGPRRWQNLALESEPPARSCHAFAARPDGEIFMFSGYLAGGSMPYDAWSFDGTGWSEASLASGGPEGRRFAMAAHDEERGITVVAGGYDAAFTERKDAWAWDGATWSALPDLPGGRYGGAMVWDAGAGALLALAGVNGSVEVLELAFESAGPEWVDVSAPGGPEIPASPQPYLDAAFDRKRSVTVLFFRGQTWEFDRKSRSWRLATSEGPGNRRGPALAYDPERARIVLFGGMSGSDKPKTVHDDTWEYDGAAWHEASPEGRPPERWEGKLAVDAPRRRLVLFGGGAQDLVNPPVPWEPAGVTWVYYAPDD